MQIQPLRTFIVAVLLFASICTAQTTQPQPERKLYLVGYAHLDTQWRWSYPQVIAEFLHNTMTDNFKLFDKYPHYVFNFTGANRYMLLKEYYPQEFEQLKKYVAAGKWFPAGSSMEEGDANMPSGEALIRQVLYGNEFFRKEFGKQSAEFMLPDTFGFQASLPSILAHCGLKGFSTQKLTWGSAVGIPFNVGVWEGPDGRGVVAAFNPGSYTSNITEDMSYNKEWADRIEQNGEQSGVYVDYHYYGTGDRGGGPKESSVQWVEKSVTSDGPVKVISATAEQMFVDLTPQQIEKLPKYKGDLLLTNHSAGSLTSEAYIKRWNRKNEQLADAAERAAVAANWLGSSVYPMQKLNDAWRLVLGAHFHDTMAGTALPQTYEYSWNNEVLAMNAFAAVTQDSVGGVARGMNTQVQGIPLVVYNPLSFERQDIAEATVEFPNNVQSIGVFDPDGRQVPSQIISLDDNKITFIFLAKVPSVGMTVYDVRPGSLTTPNQELKASETSLENSRYLVTLNTDGDITSIFDKTNQHEALSAPMRLAFLHEKPAQYPAWNMDWNDRSKPPYAYVSGPAKIHVVEAGPVRAAVELERQSQGSKFVQQIRLTAGDDKIEIASTIDWQTRESSLEAVFPLNSANSQATYESQSAAIQRGNNDPKKFEVPQQQWMDLTAIDGKYGTAILNESKYGSDKPDDNTLRLTLLYTPGVHANYQDQATQDTGRHEMIYALAPHAGDWRQGNVPAMAARLNQPLMTFQTSVHPGSLGKSFSMLHIDSDHVSAMAMKKAEDTDEIIVRLHELDGQNADDVHIAFASPIQSAKEVDGQEREIGPAAIQDGQLVVKMSPFSLHAFAVKLAAPGEPLATAISQPMQIDYDLDAVSTREKPSDGSFDSDGHTYPAEALPDKISTEGIDFTLGPTADGKNNVLTCHGQSIPLPDGFDRAYMLASAINGDQPATFTIDGKPTNLTIQNWTGYIGQWDLRLWQGVVPALTYNWNNRFAGLAPGFIKRDTVAWFSSQRRDPNKGIEYYKFSYLFKYGLDVSGAKTLTLPNNPNVRIFAMTAAKNVHDGTVAVWPLYDTLKDHVADGSPQIDPAGGAFTDATPVTIAHPLYWHASGLHYSIDGSEPTTDSPLYTQPLLLTRDTKVRARQFDPAGHGGSETSAEFHISDKTPSVVRSAWMISASQNITVDFSEALNKASAENVAHYQLEPAATVQSAKLSDDGKSVALNLSQRTTTPLHLTVSDVADLAPQANKIISKEIAVDEYKPVFSLPQASEPQNQKIAALPSKAKDAWTINLFLRIPKQLDDHTLIAGFGKPEDSTDGIGRYLSKFADGIHFWSRNRDVNTGTPLDTNRWQMLTVTFDGQMVRVYKNGVEIGKANEDFVDDETVVHVAPIDPWDKRRRLNGEVRDFTIWNVALPPEAIGSLQNELSELK